MVNMLMRLIPLRLRECRAVLLFPPLRSWHDGGLGAIREQDICSGQSRRKPEGIPYTVIRD
jgi:hypothetical protein